MEYIIHRRNTIAELNNTPVDCGVEVDIRSESGRLVIHHDPFVVGEDFDTWAAAYRHGTLILNVKEEGLEQEVLGCMSRHNITNFFFLDQSFPFIVKWANMGEPRCAVRVSEFESVETALTLAGRIDWVWVDCFTHFPLALVDYQRLKEAGFRLCLVSPELQGRNAETEIPRMRDLIAKKCMTMDAICTKKPELWGRTDV
ncbi:phosphatidylinositol-specific phospholipase C/glycerophosphodiester phosphodiesterase family protein [Prodigiosinella aquatilis]|nr:phosphatidylinositol-specific phospholipase C/glycerophosphodiester phosphodiesterase family protein [Prodigiosinella sp. LS101]WJV54601.1 phosphatidylinositol-specific phospholipase C/glycerophosphodiester phosphodiesterase family protein [Prodigiosinella sp. LS101]WJV58963.1 phosphatidylinositol-specific phospholipase C/glycerophosphodiester phosphodiesterase family protein [Pectobacteriaceae bacterium C111]